LGDNIDFLHTAIQYFAAKVYLQVGEVDYARELLHNALRVSQNFGLKYLTFIISGLLAGIFLNMGFFYECRQYAAQCLKMAAEEDYIQVFLTDQDYSPVLRMGIEYDIEAEFVQRIIVKKGIAVKPMLLDLLQHGEANIKNRAAQLLYRIGQAPAAEDEGGFGALQGASHALVQCFGDFQVFLSQNPKVSIEWRTTKAKELFAYFIDHRQRSMPRQQIITDLWPEVPPEQAATFLHTNLYHVRQILKSAGEKNSIQYENGAYRLHLEDIVCNAAVFDNLIQKIKTEAGNETAQDVKDMEQAVSLYQGDYMADSKWEWAISRRDEYSRQYFTILKRIAHYYLQQKKYQKAIDYLQIALRLNPLLEETHLMLMEAQSAIGDRKAVIRQYEFLRRTFVEELGIEPSADTKKSYYKMLE
jgi:DNA-binding SARP family transcriptional activator